MIRVFVADDHQVVRDSLARLLNTVLDMKCVGSAASIEELLLSAADSQWDVLILDLSELGGLGAGDVLAELHRLQPGLPIIVYSMYPEAAYAPRMIRAGAAAYLEKGGSTERMLELIRCVCR